jgi:copper chaperone CopZ
MTMFRRRFIQSISFAGIGGLAGAAETNGNKTVMYRVKGFSCPTCAVGLEVMLRRQPGVVQAQASYPNATVRIEFQPKAVTESALKGFIAEMGFSAEEEPKRQ